MPVSPSLDLVRQCLRYEAGKLFWLRRPREHFMSDWLWKQWNSRHADKEAGSSRSYVRGGARWIVGLNYRQFKRAQIGWLLCRGEWRMGLDHKDRDTLNDDVENLRLATQHQNRANIGRQSNNTSGVKGVFYEASRGKWIAQIGRKKIGRFDDLSEASAAYREAARSRYGEFACSD